MVNNIKLINIFRDRIFTFIFFQYFSYVIQICNSLVIAKLLGPYYFGIYGFMLLIIQYLSYSNFGVQFSLSFFLSKNLNRINNKERRVLGLTYISTIITSIFIVLIGIAILPFEIGILDKYFFSDFLIWVLGIGIINNWNQVYVNLYRNFGKYNQISAFYVLPQILILLVLFFVSKNFFSIKLLLGSQFLGFAFSLLLFNLHSPLKPKWQIRLPEVKGFYQKAIALMLYNFCFYLFIISTRSLIGLYYNVEEMGIFSFSNSISNAITMGLGVVSFIVFPKFIHKLKGDMSNEDTFDYLKRNQSLFFYLTSLLTFLAISIYPFFITIFPQYKDSVVLFSLLMIAQLIQSSLFGYSELLLSRNFEKKLIINSIFAFIVNICGIYLLHLYVSFHYIPLMTVFSVLIYVCLTIRDAGRILNIRGLQKLLKLLFTVFPINTLIPLFLILFLIFIDNGEKYFCISIVVFLLLSIGDLKNYLGRLKAIYIVK